MESCLVSSWSRRGETASTENECDNDLFLKGTCNKSIETADNVRILSDIA